jgi:hypothetical protein
MSDLMKGGQSLPIRDRMSVFRNWTYKHSYRYVYIYKYMYVCLCVYGWTSVFVDLTRLPVPKIHSIALVDHDRLFPPPSSGCLPRELWMLHGRCIHSWLYCGIGTRNHASALPTLAKHHERTVIIVLPSFSAWRAPNSATNEGQSAMCRLFVSWLRSRT